MYLPDAEHATIAPEKVTAYLLVPEHRDNRGKAAFFFRYGFRMDTWEMLAVALVVHGGAHPITDTRQRLDGMLYEVTGDMAMPDGRVRRMLTAWFVPNEGGAPRFVTAYPA
jgi:hypothetical protein